MISIADLSSEIRLDQMEAGYRAKTIIYRKERTILVFAIITAGLSLLIGGLFYYSIRQKHRYEKLLQQTKNRELAFINSHEVRKHLANILGLCNLVNETNPDKDELVGYYKYLNSSAHEMDKCLKSIERKLSESA